MWPFKRKENEFADLKNPNLNVDEANALFESIGSDFRVKVHDPIDFDFYRPLFKAIADLQKANAQASLSD